jgi:NAD(P)-dependent dehydrogenase (short-subunit alcohol dehydrogenase family)
MPSDDSPYYCTVACPLSVSSMKHDRSIETIRISPSNLDLSIPWCTIPSNKGPNLPNCAANIAGVLGGSGLIRDSTGKDWDFVMGVNDKGVSNSLRAQLSHIKEGGSIVNFASIALVATLQTQGANVASKHAVLGLTKTATLEEGPDT